MWSDFLSLIFPNICQSCEGDMVKNERVICSHCKVHLPRTNFHYYYDNPVNKLFWGKSNITSASAFYHFNKGSKVQHLIHNLKYKGQKEVGVIAGRLFAQDLQKSELFNTVSLIVPVPLHPKKLKKRGFNQSEYIAIGLSEGLKAPISIDNLVRNSSSETQTKRKRFERWQNVESAFHLLNAEKVRNEHILLVDDVITTGSTIEACASRLLEVEGVKVSVATLAYASI